MIAQTSLERQRAYSRQNALDCLRIPRRPACAETKPVLNGGPAPSGSREDGLRAIDHGGLDVSLAPSTSFPNLGRPLTTLQASLTDPGMFSGIGNVTPTDLHRAQLSPVPADAKNGSPRNPELFHACSPPCADWTETALRQRLPAAFPRKSRRPQDMAVHGKIRQPCPSAAPKCNASATPPIEPTMPTL